VVVKTAWSSDTLNIRPDTLKRLCPAPVAGSVSTSGICGAGASASQATPSKEAKRTPQCTGSPKLGMRAGLDVDAWVDEAALELVEGPEQQWTFAHFVTLV